MQTQRVLDEFKNEPFSDYSNPEKAAAMQAAIEKVRGELGREYPMRDRRRENDARQQVSKHKSGK